MNVEKVMFAMDGTIPVAIGVLVGEDGAEEHVGQGIASELETVLCRVYRTAGDDGPVRYLAVYVNENGGPEDVVGFSDGVAAGAWLRDFPVAQRAAVPGGPTIIGPVEEVSPGHWAVTYLPDTDRESYGHVYRLPD